MSEAPAIATDEYDFISACRSCDGNTELYNYCTKAIDDSADYPPNFAQWKCMNPHCEKGFILNCTHCSKEMQLKEYTFQDLEGRTLSNWKKWVCTSTGCETEFSAFCDQSEPDKRTKRIGCEKHPDELCLWICEISKKDKKEMYLLRCQRCFHNEQPASKQRRKRKSGIVGYGCSKCKVY